MEKKRSSEDPTQDAGSEKTPKHPAAYIHMTPERAATASQAGPERDRVGGICRDWRHSGEQQRRKSYEAAASGHSIHDSRYQRRPKKQRRVYEIEFSTVQSPPAAAQNQQLSGI
jgi:hypothetical protein